MVYGTNSGEQTNLVLNLEATTLRDGQQGKSRCFAFIVFKEPESLQKCFAQTEHAINSKKGGGRLDSFTVSSSTPTDRDNYLELLDPLIFLSFLFTSKAVWDSVPSRQDNQRYYAPVRQVLVSVSISLES